ncbi:hypothetical protein HY419_01645 [candidate division WWE3 bacterium]|nr:hypothetical protein [candidate division WWE3 bacterium]
MKYFNRDFLLFLSLFFILYKPPADPDLWWHLKYGELMVNGLSIPLRDVFSHTMSGYIWPDSYWLSQIIMFLTGSFGGLFFVSLVFSALLSALMVLVSRNLRNFPARVAALFMAVIGFSFPVVTVRPLFFSTVFLFFLWWVLLFRRRDGILLFIPLVFLLWANLHADFVVGLSVLLTYSFFCFAHSLASWNFKKFVIPAVTALASIAATFVNPFGAGLHKALGNEVLSMSVQGRYISEWSPAQLWSSLFVYMVVLIGFLLWALLNRSVVFKGLFEEKPRYKGWFVLVVLVVTSLLSIRSSYFIRVLAIFSIPLVYLFFDRVAALPELRAVRIPLPYTVVGLTVLALIFIQSLVISLDFKLLSEYGDYPFGAVRFVRRNRPAGNMFNLYRWGGYLVFTLPEYKTFIDGRMASWSNENWSILQAFVKIEGARDSDFIDTQFEKHGVGWVLLQPQSRLTGHLSSKGWRTLYEDRISVVMAR